MVILFWMVVLLIVAVDVAVAWWWLYSIAAWLIDRVADVGEWCRRVRRAHNEILRLRDMLIGVAEQEKFAVPSPTAGESHVDTCSLAGEA